MDTSRTLLVVEDNEDDLLLLLSAIEETGFVVDIKTVSDGTHLLDYLRREGRYRDPKDSPRPSLVLLDLKLPTMDGPDALEQVKADPKLRGIPVVMLTTSWSERDIERCYNLGAASFIIKPLTLDSLTSTLDLLLRYWFDVCELTSLQDS